MNNDNQNIDQIDNIPDKDKKGTGNTLLKFVGIILLLILLAKLMEWLLK